MNATYTTPDRIKVQITDCGAAGWCARVVSPYGGVTATHRPALEQAEAVAREIVAEMRRDMQVRRRA